ncbi:MAG: nuclease, partial [Chloroflexi bacterium]|nr:nuclease [Chloroflexota bacterium]
MSQFERLPILSLLLLSLALVACNEPEVSTLATPPRVGGEEGFVTFVVDGDTVDVAIQGEVFRVRYIGVDTPESNEPCFDEATAANAQLVAGQNVTLVRDVSDTDQFGRLLRYVYVGTVFV